MCAARSMAKSRALRAIYIFVFIYLFIYFLCRFLVFGLLSFCLFYVFFFVCYFAIVVSSIRVYSMYSGGYGHMTERLFTGGVVIMAWPEHARSHRPGSHGVCVTAALTQAYSGNYCVFPFLFGRTNSALTETEK